MTDATHTPGPLTAKKKGKQVMIAETLTKMEACEEAVEWSRGKTLAECWAAYDRPDWMLWLMRQIGIADNRRYRLAACRFVRDTPLADGRTVWDLLTDPRSRGAVEVAEQYANNAASSDELHAAWDAAHAAVRSASYAAWAAWDAAKDVASDAAKDVASDAAKAVASYAAWAAWDAGKDVASDAAKAVASDAAWAAGAARAAAWDAAWAAAWNAGWLAAGAAARVAARVAAWVAVSDATWLAAQDASDAAWDAAQDASDAALDAVWDAARDAQCKMIRDMWSLEEVEAAWAKKAGKS